MTNVLLGFRTVNWIQESDSRLVMSLPRLVGGMLYAEFKTE